MDTNTNFIDVSSFTIDLAVHGYLVVTAQKDGNHLLTRTEKDQRGPVYRERKLLSRLFQSGDEVTLKELGDEKYDGLDSEIRELLYQRATELDWLRENPKSIRWSRIVAGFFTVTVGRLFSLVLGYGIDQGLVCPPVAAIGVAVLIISGKFGERTARGSATLIQARGFELYLHTTEADKSCFEESVDTFSRYLPCAMVFGVARRWTALSSQLKLTNRFEADMPWCQGIDLHASNSAFYAKFNDLCYNSSDAMFTAHEAARVSNYSLSSFSSSSYISSETSEGSRLSGGGGFPSSGFSDGS